MSEHKENHLTAAERSREASRAAELVLAARRMVGNGSSYDHFLCNFTGDAAPLSPNFQPIDQVAPSGRVYTYNNPFLVGKAYSPDGLMVNYRRASQPTTIGEEGYEFFVATLDLRTDETVIWTAADVYKSPDNKEMRVGLIRRRPYLSMVEGGRMSTSESENVGQQFDAWLLLSQERGSNFVTNGRWEALDSLDRLVAEVNSLTELDALELDSIRESAAYVIGNVIPFTAEGAA